jgi:serine/threonine protein kinase
MGNFPKELIDTSPLKQVFFTEKHILKCMNYTEDFYRINTWTDILKNISGETAKKYLMIDLMMDMLKMDPRKRISAYDALQHPLFKMYCTEQK